MKQGGRAPGKIPDGTRILLCHAGLAGVIGAIDAELREIPTKGRAGLEA